MFYIVTTPWWLKKFYSKLIWEMPKVGKIIYLTFDDGPHPLITPHVLDVLKAYNAKATFFCIGKNVVENPSVYKRILEDGHAVGNHTYNHLNGWKTSKSIYLANILEAQKYIDSDLFRPPYGRISRYEQKALAGLKEPFKIIMWSILSGDFDVNISPEQCCKNVIENAKNGSVIVFHDSEKANERMYYSLPIVLRYFTEKGYLFEKIDLNK